MDAKPLVGIVMGSTTDWDTMQHTCAILDEFGVPYEKRVISAHRAPDALAEWAKSARARGLEVIIGGAGGAAHLPGVTAAYTTLPVLGVPMQSAALNGIDSLLSIVQMPGGIPVGTLGIGKGGAVNAALLAVAIVALHRPVLIAALEAYRARQTQKVLDAKLPG
jgi:5-(carboxyamino)imidazole ribonucleotide mutase